MPSVLLGVRAATVHRAAPGRHLGADGDGSLHRNDRSTAAPAGWRRGPSCEAIVFVRRPWFPVSIAREARPTTVESNYRLG